MLSNIRKPRLQAEYLVLYMVLVKYIKTVYRCPPFGTILLATETLSYEIMKFLVLRMNSIISNEFTVKDLFA